VQLAYDLPLFWRERQLNIAALEDIFQQNPKNKEAAPLILAVGDPGREVELNW